MRCAGAARRRLLISQNLGGQRPPRPPTLLHAWSCSYYVRLLQLQKLFKEVQLLFELSNTGMQQGGRPGGPLPPQILEDQIAPPFHRPPQIFRLCCIPGYCLRIQGRLKCICGKFELHDLLRRLCQFLFSLLYGQNGGRGPAPPPVPPSWVI